MKFRPLILANLFRKKLRTDSDDRLVRRGPVSLRPAGGGARAFNQGVDAGRRRPPGRHQQVSIIQPLPLSYRDQILRIPGVKGVTHRQLVWRRLPGRKEFLPAICHRSRQPAPGVPRVQGAGRPVEGFRRDRQGAIAGAGTGQALRLEGWRPHSAQGADLPRRPGSSIIRGIYTAPTEDDD